MKIFIAHSERDRDLVVSLVAVLREDEHTVLVPSEMKTGTDILAEISAGIRSADVLIAVVTTGNPNIFYEMGLAGGASVPMLIAARADQALPANLSAVPYVRLTGDVLRDAQMVARRTKDLEGLATTTKATQFKSAEAALKAASQDPAVLESLGPADFEQLVAELFKERGFEVEATTSTRDTGVDFIMRSKKERELVVVEVKKLSRQSRVSVEAVRQLLGVVSGLGASMGILVAPSGFTAAALALAAGTPLLLRTLGQVLSAKSEKELLESKEEGS